MKEIITTLGRLVLYEGTQIDISKNNPLFTRAEEFTIDLSVPRKPNDAILGNMYRITGGVRPGVIDARFIFHGREKLSGSIEVVSVTDKEYRLILKGSRNDFLYRYGSVLLSDLDFPWEDFVPGNPNPNEFMIQAEMKETLTQNRDWICFPVWHSGDGRWINRWSIDTQGFLWDAGGWRTAFPRIGRTMEKLFALKGYTVTDNWFTVTGERRNLVFFNNSATLADQISLKYLLPDWSVKEMIDELEDYFPITIFINSRTKKVRIVGDDNVVNEPVSFDLDGFLKYNPEVVYNERKQGYQLVYDLPKDDDTTDFDFEFLDEAWATPVDKYADLPTTTEDGATYFVTSEGQYYRAKYTEAEGNMFLTWDLTGSVAMSVRAGLKEIERTTKIYPLLNYRNEVKETVTLTQQYVGTQRKEVTFWLQVPVTQKAQVRWGEDLRIMCYRTIVNAEYNASDVTEGYLLPLIRYPFANFVARDNIGNSIANSAVELRWDGDKGLRGAEAIEFMDNAIVVNCEMVVSHLMYDRIDLSRVFSIMGRKGLISEMTVHFMDSESIEIEAKVLVR